MRHHHLPLQRHVEKGGGFEVHREVVQLSIAHMLSSDVVLQGARPASLRPIIRVPPTRLQAIHAILHDQVGYNWRRRRCGLRMLYGVARRYARPEARTELAGLVDDVPLSARPIVRHGLALSGLLGAPVDRDDTRRACDRYRKGMVYADRRLADALLTGFSQFRVQPVAAINILDPSRLPERIARLKRYLR